MRYEEPKMHILSINDEDIVRTSIGGGLETDPDKKVPGEGEDSGAW